LIIAEEHKNKANEDLPSDDVYEQITNGVNGGVYEDITERVYTEMSTQTILPTLKYQYLKAVDWQNSKLFAHLSQLA